MQYRFGVALAGAKGAEQRKKDDVPSYSRESAWGENEVIISYAGGGMEEKFIDEALKELGLSTAKKQITTSKSEEPTSTQKDSPLKPFKGYGR